MSAAWQHWHVARDAHGVVTAAVDRQGASTNALSVAVMTELAQILDRLETDPPKALIIRSAKPAGFIAGADIGEFAGLDHIGVVTDMVARGWHLFNRLAAVAYPTLALVRGHCLGGGLELALACRYLLVVDEPGTRLGLPEVMLGIFPGWGGMRRLPERIGAAAALDLMLTGRTVDARRARSLGLADASVPARVMESAARQLVLSGQAPRTLSWWQSMLAGPFKGLVARQARQKTAQKVQPQHYPAPYAILNIWQHHGGNALDAPEILARLIASPTTTNLLRVFHLQERLKALGKSSSSTAQRVHVVGAGVMGGDIAAWCALNGLTVTLQDQGMDRIAAALKRAHGLFEKKLRDPLRVRAAWDRLIPDPQGQGVEHADVVIEAIFENLSAKQAMLQGLEPRLKPSAILASNTSSLRLEDMRVGLKRPERLVGLHFFNPVAAMPLVEVVEADGADPAVVQAACAFARQIDKWPLPVRSAPGFLVNAVLAPYMLEAMRAVDEGLSPETVDAAMLDWGMPMGPIELADTVGLDIALAAGQQLAAGALPPRCLVERVEQQHLGKKTQQGFYAWQQGRPRKRTPGAVPEGLADRLLKPLTQRAASLVEQGVVADADLADAGVIFGAGFAPFRGGPLQWIKQG